MLPALDIQCFRCGGVSRTPLWPSDEPLPSALVTIGSKGAFLLKSTVETNDSVFTCDGEIERVALLMGVRPPVPAAIEFSDQGLARAEAELAIMCRSFTACLARTKVAESRRNYLFLKFPPAWALQQMRRSVREQKFDAKGPDGVAYTFLQMTLSTLTRWRGHPYFASIADPVLFEFHHSMAQLIAASYLADHGNRIGFEAVSLNGERTPDMFVNLGATSRLSLEVKAPAVWQWPRQLPEHADISEVIQQKVKQSRGQIKGDGGVLVLGATVADLGFSGAVEKVLRVLFKEQKISSRIAAVALVNLCPHPSVTRKGEGRLGLEASAEVFALRNPKFSGNNPVVTG